MAVRPHCGLTRPQYSIGGELAANGPPHIEKFKESETTSAVKGFRFFLEVLAWMEMLQNTAMISLFLDVSHNLPDGLVFQNLWFKQLWILGSFLIAVCPTLANSSTAALRRIPNFVTHGCQKTLGPRSARNIAIA